MEPAVMQRCNECNQCNQQLIEIDNRGERLTGCLPCNLWAASGEKLWITLSQEDVLALHMVVRQARASKVLPRPHRSN